MSAKLEKPKQAIHMLKHTHGLHSKLVRDQGTVKGGSLKARQGVKARLGSTGLSRVCRCATSEDINVRPKKVGKVRQSSGVVRVTVEVAVLGSPSLLLRAVLWT